MHKTIGYVAGLTVAFFVSAEIYAQAMPPMPSQEEPEILAHGPVHEAFAEPVNLAQAQSVIAPIAPPGVIGEVAPDGQPSSLAVWIDGYWAWDTVNARYIWVSGCWRIPPSGKRWVPGYWTPTDRGWLWTSGYWTDIVAPTQTVYLPAPPPIESLAPPITVSSVDLIWVPPCWYWRNGSYVLRQGYWINAYPGWVWQPSHYVCTPRGYVFVAGYWDYPLTARGVLYAPAVIPTPIISRSSFTLSLGVSVNLGWLEVNLFSAPSYGHYYFGDYYDVTYVRYGIYPAYQCRTTWTWYDPVYEHRRWSGRSAGDKHWDERDQRYFDERRDNRNLRPPRTWRDVEQRASKPDNNLDKGRPGNRDFDRGSPLVRWQPDRDSNKPSDRRDSIVPSTPPPRPGRGGIASNRGDDHGERTPPSFPNRGVNAPGRDDKNAPDRPAINRDGGRGDGTQRDDHAVTDRTPPGDRRPSRPENDRTAPDMRARDNLARDSNVPREDRSPKPDTIVNRPNLNTDRDSGNATKPVFGADRVASRSEGTARPTPPLFDVKTQVPDRLPDSETRVRPNIFPSARSGAEASAPARNSGNISTPGTRIQPFQLPRSERTESSGNGGLPFPRVHNFPPPRPPVVMPPERSSVRPQIPARENSALERGQRLQWKSPRTRN